MKLYFWQNVISIHQSAFLKALSAEHEVHLMVSEEISPTRIKQGWSVPEIGNIEIIISPDNRTIVSALNTKDALHIFSGIDAFPMVFKAFKLAIANKCKISVMAEPYNWKGFKGLLRRIKYLMLFKKYGRYIDHFFTTGYQGIKCYRKSGLKASKIHHWGYFTEFKTSDSNLHHQQHSKSKLLYVGRIDHNKNIIPVLKKFNVYEDFVEQFTIIGIGPLSNELKEIASHNPKIKVLGRVNNSEVTSIMSNHDYLILPSLYDGWGAVINEALSQGTRVLCSDACGASALLDGNFRGEVFTQKNIENTIIKWCKKGALSKQEREAIRNWSANNISGKAAADYFVKILSELKVQAPWIEN